MFTKLQLSVKIKNNLRCNFPLFLHVSFKFSFISLRLVLSFGWFVLHFEALVVNLIQSPRDLPLRSMLYYSILIWNQMEGLQISIPICLTFRINVIYVKSFKTKRSVMVNNKYYVSLNLLLI
ncbi:MAG: hypothetical protein ACKERF_01585 [Candidatus Hodgkinia cicadicola]